MKIEMRKVCGERKLCIIAYNEGGYNATVIPVEDIVEEVNKSKHPVSIEINFYN